MKIMNNITSNVYSDEWYTNQETVDLCWKLLDVETNDKLCFPFDSAESLFVKKAIENNHSVIYGIDDFIGSSNYDFDKLLTNPPFSQKDKVIETVYAYNKPSCLVLPMDSLGGVKRHSMYANNAPSVYLPTRRINYFDQDWVKRPGANFHSIIMLFNTNQTSRILWEFDIERETT
jgi:hypothetical protein